MVIELRSKARIATRAKGGQGDQEIKVKMRIVRGVRRHSGNVQPDIGIEHHRFAKRFLIAEVFSRHRFSQDDGGTLGKRSFGIALDQRYVEHLKKGRIGKKDSILIESIFTLADRGFT